MLKNLKIKNYNISVYLFLLVPLIIYIAFFIMPNINALYYSFFRWNGVSIVKEFIGLENYINIFTDSVFFKAFKNTLVYSGTLILGINIFGLIIAVLIYKKNTINSIFRTIFFIPYILSSVAIGFIWGLIIFDPNVGIINTFLNSIGFGNFAVNWLYGSKTAIFAVVVTHMWSAIGEIIIWYIVGLQNISAELYEAAEIDGANKFQTFLYVTLPSLKATISVCLIISSIMGFVVFDIVYVMTKGGGFDHSSEVLATLLYKEGYAYNNIGYSAAISVILLIIVMIVSILFTRIRVYEQ